MFAERAQAIAHELDESGDLLPAKAQLIQSSKHGFHLALTGLPDADPLPSVLIPLESGAPRAGRRLATTYELIALNAVLRDSSDDCMLLSYNAIEACRSRVRTRLRQIHCALDNLAMLDMLVSFARAATTLGGYVRPVISEHGPWAAKDARHPLVERTTAMQYVPNATFLSDASSVHIVRCVQDK